MRRHRTSTTRRTVRQDKATRDLLKQIEAERERDFWLMTEQIAKMRRRHKAEDAYTAAIGRTPTEGAAFWSQLRRRGHGPLDIRRYKRK